MSGNERPELRAYRELESLVRNLGEELATFRRRAIAAEAQLKDAGSGHGHGGGPKAKSAAVGERLTELEQENEALSGQLKGAEERVREMMDRVRFLRQQLQVDSGAKVGRA